MSFKLIMPMAGNGSRFSEQGYTVPKPLIAVDGKPMFVKAIDCLGLDFDEYIFIVKREHNLSEEIEKYFNEYICNSTIIELDETTEGAACTVLTADSYIQDNDSIMVCNCDQIIKWDNELWYTIPDSDGIILVFDEPTADPKWSFAQLDDWNKVIKVAEKDPISTWATTGHYYWKRWDTFRSSARAMIDADDRTNNEFYLCPVYNHTPGTIRAIPVNEMHGVGTPEDLNTWLNL